MLNEVQLVELSISVDGRRTKGLERCSAADRSSSTIEETNSSLAWTDINEAPIASGGSPLAHGDRTTATP